MDNDNNNPDNISWHNPPIDNKNGQQYLRLYSAVSSIQYPTQTELDQIVQIVKEDFLPQFNQ